MENLSSLEYNKEQWSVYRYVNDETEEPGSSSEDEDTGSYLVDMDDREIFKMVMKEFQV